MESEPKDKNQADNAAATSCVRGPCCPLQSRWGRLMWVLLIAALVYVQWPTIKGIYYKSTGAAAQPSAVSWRNDYEAVLAEAAQSGKEVLIDFSASWCPPCQVMKHEVWPDREVGQAVSARYVPLLIDVDDQKHAEVAARYGVRGIPTVLIVDAKGKVLRQGSFMSKSEMLEFLSKQA